MNVQDKNNLNSKLKETGFVTINNFLDGESIQTIDKELKNISTTNINKGDKRGYYPVRARAKIIKLLKFDISSI